ncbi:MAG: LemA family protein [Paludibacter sp.]
MKKSTIIILVSVAAFLFLFILLPIGYGVSSYNKLVTSEEIVNSQWANVESQYQRRADLIPNLVQTVKGYATHESSTLEGVMEARAKATQITIDPKNMTPEKLQQYQAAQGQVGAALGRLMVVSENYPNLKANENFLELQAQLEGTENRIAVERGRFNELAKSFNTDIRRFPTNIVAGMTGFQKKPYFEAEKAAAKAPAVKF